jgi:hypothetical protein
MAAFRSGAVAVALALAVAACGGSGASPTTAIPTGQATQAAQTAAAGTPVSGQTALDDIPPGRGIAEGGGGPLSYTFREEWRKARVEALKWRSGAYLVMGAGSFVNDDGVPSSWALTFVDGTAAGGALLVEIDPWGAVTSTRELTGSDATSLVGPHAGRIPYGVIDSDTAVAAGKTALTARYDMDNTRDPRLGLGFSAADGSGPYWTYTVFNEPTAAYVSARIDALGGTATLVE